MTLSSPDEGSRSPKACDENYIPKTALAVKSVVTSIYLLLFGSALLFFCANQTRRSSGHSFCLLLDYVDVMDATTQPSLLLPSCRGVTQRNIMEKNKKIVFWIGVVEIILGLIVCVIGIVTLGKPHTRRHNDHWYLYGHERRQFNVGQGVWYGFIFIVSGILGVCVRYKTTRCIYLANLIISIFAVLLMLTLVALSCVSASADHGTENRFSAWYIVSALIGACGIVIAIMHASFSNVWASNGTKPEGRIVYTSIPQQPMIPVQMPNGQIMYCTPQPFCNVSSNLNHGNAQYSVLPMALTIAHQPVFPTQPNINQVQNPSTPYTSNTPTLTMSSTLPLVSSNSPQTGNTSIDHPDFIVLPPVAALTTPFQQSEQDSIDRPPSYSEFAIDD